MTVFYHYSLLFITAYLCSMNLSNANRQDVVSSDINAASTNNAAGKILAKPFIIFTILRESV